MFHDEYAAVDATVAELLGAGRDKEARQLLHKVKGAASVLGLPRVIGSSADLGAAIREKRPTETPMTAFREAMDEVIEGLAPWCG